MLINRRAIAAVILCAGLLTGCGSSQEPSTPKVDTSLQMKESYTNKELLALTGYRKGAVKLVSSVKAPNVSTVPTALSITLKAEHLVMNKGIKLKNNKLTEETVKKAGYSSISALKAEAKKILIKQNKELRPTLTGSLACADAYAKAKITVTEKDRKSYKKLADNERYTAGKKKKEKNIEIGAETEENVKKMLFVSAVIAREKTKLTKKDTSKSPGSDFSSYTDFYRGSAAKMAAEKALDAYAKEIVKK